jgi:hypothetical protein
MTISARGIGKTVHSSDQAAFSALMVAARKHAGLTQHELAYRLKRPQSPFGKSGMSVSADEDAAHGDVDHGG